MKYRLVTHVLCLCSLLTAFVSAQTVTFSRDILGYDTHYPFADFNHDGREDLIAPCGNLQVGVALSTGDGSYSSPTCYPLPSGQIWDTPAIGDFNSDGSLDLAISNGSSTVYEYLNDGKGNFHVARSIQPGGTTSTLATADVNHDGIIDLLCFEYGAQVLHVLFGKPDGTFAVGPTTTFANGSGGNAIYPGDFDGDGKADIVWQSPFFETDIQVAYGDGHGHFDLKPSFQDIVFYQVYDVDRDGRSDLVGVPFIPEGAGDPVYFKEIRILHGNSNRTFTSQTIALTQCNGGPGLAPAVADFNGDGINDIAVVEASDCKSSPPFTVNVLLGTGGGIYQPEQVVFSTSDIADPSQLEVIRLDHDSKPDLKLVGYTANHESARTFLFRNTTPGNFPKCNPPNHALGFNLCSPTRIVSPNNSVRFSVAAGNQTDGRKVEIWVDGKKMAENLKGFSHYSFLDTTLKLAPGTHRVAIFSAGWDNLVEEYMWTGGPGVTFPLTVGSNNCPTQGEGLVICSPLNDATLKSPVRAWAVGQLSRTNIARMEVWVDGQKKFSTFGSNTLKTSIDLPSGAHQFTYFLIGADGTKLSSKVNATVR